MPNNMQNNPLVSIVVVNYNGRIFLESCIASILRSDYPNYEVIFVDNASTDGSVEALKRLFGKEPRLRIIRNSENLGFAEGNNVGVRHSKGEYIVFLNVDTEVDRNWLKELIEVMASDPRIGGAQCKIMVAQDRKRTESTGHFVDYCGVESIEGMQVLGQIDRGQYGKIRDIFYAKGAAMAVSRKALREVGLFDPSFFIDHEEIDLCWRINLRGYRIVFVPKAVIYHYGGFARGAHAQRKTFAALFHLRKNNIMSLIKNYELANLFRYLPRYTIYLLLHAAYSMRKGEGHVAMAYLKAMLWVLTSLKTIYLERKRVQGIIRRVPDKQVMRLLVKPTIPWHFLE